MSYYRICPICGAHLDPGERCDCKEEEARRGEEEEDGKRTQSPAA